MIINSYIFKEFFKRLFIAISLTLITSVLISGIESILSCSEYCSIKSSIMVSFYSSILFVESSIFFIIILATTWLTITLSNTHQYITITIYSKKKTLILNSLLMAIGTFSVTYITLFSSIIIPNIKNYIASIGDGNGHYIEKVWINTLNVENDSASGSVYFMKNIKKYLDGYSLDSLSIYKIKGGYLTSYEKFNKPFLTASVDNDLMFIFRDSNGKISRNIERGVSIDSIGVEFKRNSHQNNIGFTEAVLSLVSIHRSGSSYTGVMQAQVAVITTLEKVLIFFLAIIVSLCEFPAYHQRINGVFRKKILRVLFVSIMCYTSLEMLKIIGGGTVSSYIASLACCAAFLCIFLSRLIKHHH